MELRPHEELADDFGSWEEVQDCLQGAWMQMWDDGTGLHLARGPSCLFVFTSPEWRASDRRALHRRGFRLQPGPATVWCWDAPQSPPPADDDGLSPAPPGLPARFAASLLHVRREQEVDRRLAAKALEVLREVFDVAPTRLLVLLDDGEEDDGYWCLDDEDEDLVWPPALG